MSQTANAYPAVEEPVVELSPRAKLEILGAILLALFLFALDQTVVLGHHRVPAHGHDQRPDLRQAV